MTDATADAAWAKLNERRVVGVVVVAECGGDDRAQVEDVSADRRGAAGGGGDADLVDQRGQCVGP